MTRDWSGPSGILSEPEDNFMRILAGSTTGVADSWVQALPESWNPEVWLHFTHLVKSSVQSVQPLEVQFSTVPLDALIPWPAKI